MNDEHQGPQPHGKFVGEFNIDSATLKDTAIFLKMPMGCTYFLETQADGTPRSGCHDDFDIDLAQNVLRHAIDRLEMTRMSFEWLKSRTEKHGSID